MTNSKSKSKLKSKPKLPLGAGISRREFFQGALVASAAVGVTPAWAFSADYPPSKTGMRGSHAGSFEVAHDLAREGKQWPVPAKLTDKPYDLIVVGAGISGLATAFLYQQKYGANASILLLDNHDDFGGHAKRNEFTVAGKKLLGYGGSQSIDSPASYSDGAQKLLRDLGIEVDKFYRHFDQSFFDKRKLKSGLYLQSEFFGRKVFLREDRVYDWQAADGIELATPEYLSQFPFTEAERESLHALLNGHSDWLAPMAESEKLDYLKAHSYSTFLIDKLAIPARVLALVEERLDGWWGLGTDAVSALEAWRNGLPGFAGLGLQEPHTEHGDEPYIFHFPDGNASIARLLVRRLIPQVAVGASMEDIVLAKFDYAQLDVRNRPVRLRLSSTAVSVSNTASGAEVLYVQDGVAHKVAAGKVVLACYNAIVPHLCPTLPPVQKRALSEQVKVPMAYVNVALNNWRAIEAAGVFNVNCPRSFFTWVTMDFPVSMGGYSYTQKSDQPVVLHMPFYPKTLGQGMAPKDQYRLGRYRLLGLSFADFEREVVAQLSAMFTEFGFVAERDVAAITVNRWPHGYAYEYVDLFDPDYRPGEAPHEIGRAAFGNIHIGNSDSQAFAYVDGAIDAARRVVDEIAAVSNIPHPD